MIPNRPAPRLRANPKWSPMFADFIATCLEKDPDRRPTAQQLLQVLPMIGELNVAPVREGRSNRAGGEQGCFRGDEEDGRSNANSTGRTCETAQIGAC